jgi:hypothetical protein
MLSVCFSPRSYLAEDAAQEFAWLATGFRIALPIIGSFFSFVCSSSDG